MLLVDTCSHLVGRTSMSKAVIHRGQSVPGVRPVLRIASTQQWQGAGCLRKDLCPVMCVICQDIVLRRRCLCSTRTRTARFRHRAAHPYCCSMGLQKQRSLSKPWPSRQTPRWQRRCGDFVGICQHVSSRKPKSLLVAAAHAFASLASIAAASLPGAKEDTVGKSVSAMTRATFCSRVSDIVKG